MEILQNVFQRDNLTNPDVRKKLQHLATKIDISRISYARLTLSFFYLYLQEKCEQPSNEAETQHSSNVDTVNQIMLRSNFPQKYRNIANIANKAGSGRRRWCRGWSDIQRNGEEIC